MNTDRIDERFVIDHYSTLQEPLNAYIVWPESTIQDASNGTIVDFHEVFDTLDDA